MKDNKIVKILAIIIIILAFVLIVGAITMSMSENKKPKEVYKQCSENQSKGKKETNYEHTNINYYIDKDNNRINNSEALAKKHDSKDATKTFSIENMKIRSNNCEENGAEFKANLINNSQQEFKDFIIMFEIKNKEGETTHKFSMDIDKISKGETIQIKLKTLGRIIDAYDYEFSYITSDQLEG